jgi:hypothetical protein
VDSVTFINTVGDFFDTWLKSVALRINRGEIRIDEPYSYPTVLRVGKSPSHYIAELLGSTDIPPFHQNYKLRRPRSPEKCKSTTSFFNPGFEVGPGQKSCIQFADSVQCRAFVGFALCTEYDKALFEKKVNFSISDVIIMPPDAEVPLSIPPSVNYILFSHTDLVRTDSFRVLFRTISTAFLVKRSSTQDELLNWLTRTALDPSVNIPYMALSRQGHPDILGLNVGFDASSEGFARQLASLSDQDIDEPVIDRFIQAHANQFAGALGCKRALSQVELQWIEREPDDPKVSKPDYLLEREDGYFDILDLKRAALRYKLTVGKKARLRFSSYVGELIAQLKGYERFFRSAANRKWAMDNYGVKVRSPRLIGVVGNYDSFVRENIDLALEQYKDSVVILSYQEIVHLLRKRTILAK